MKSGPAGGIKTAAIKVLGAIWGASRQTTFPRAFCLHREIITPHPGGRSARHNHAAPAADGCTGTGRRRRPTGEFSEGRVRLLTLSLIKAAATDPIVERIFVNAAIKKALCREAPNDRNWLHKVRPYYWPARIAGRNIRCRKVKSAARISIIGSPTRSCNRSPHQSRRSRSRR